MKFLWLAFAFTLRIDSNSRKSAEDSTQPVAITANLTNTSMHKVTLLKDPRGLLSTFPTDTWTFRDSSGKRVRPKFVGARVKPMTVGDKAKGGKGLRPDALQVIEPGTSVLLDHNRKSALYIELACF